MWKNHQMQVSTWTKCIPTYALNIYDSIDIGSNLPELVAPCNSILSWSHYLNVDAFRQYLLTRQDFDKIQDCSFWVKY